MMIWAKIKTAAVCIAGLALLTGAGTPVAMNVLPKAGEKVEEMKTGKDEDVVKKKKDGLKSVKGIFVNGLAFKPVIPQKVWLALEDGKENIDFSLKVTNKGDKDIYLNKLALDVVISTPEGKKLIAEQVKGLKLRDGKPVLYLKDFVLVKKDGSIVINLHSTLKKKNKSQWMLDIPGSKCYHWLDCKKYKISLHYSSSKESGYIWDKEGNKVELAVWKGTVQTEPIPIQILLGLQTSIEKKYKEAESTLGKIGCLTVRSKARLKQLIKECNKLKWGKPDTLFSNVDFTNEMIIFFLRAGLNAEKDRIVNFLSGPEQAVIRFSTQQFPRLSTKKLYHITAVLLPQAKVLKAEIPEPVKTTGNQADGSTITIYREMHRTWTIGPHGGDIADGLQGYIEAEKKVISPGEDIKVKFTLKAADSTQKEPIHVWDGKYSNGYRNDAYLVRTPGGKIYFLRRKKLLSWRKNIPHPVAVTSEKPYVLPGNIKYDSPLKSMKNIAAEMQLSGFNTSAAGMYTITGIYMESGGPAKHGFYDRNNPPSMWGGNIATNTVQVRVEE